MIMDGVTMDCDRKITPFDFLNSINHKKDDIYQGNEKQYNSFVINRSLSYFPETVLMANEMNRYHHVDDLLQYHFLLNIVRKGKRFSKWIKPETEKDIELVKEYYGYSNDKARQIISLLTPEQKNYIRKKVDKGGRRK